MIEQTLKEVKANRTKDKVQRNTSTSKFDDILEGELSAVEAYKQAKEQFSMPLKKRIDQLCKDHKEAFRFWKDVSNKTNFDKKVGSGVWGKVVEGFVGTAKLMGETPTIKVLKKGEEHGLRQYKEMLRREDIPHKYKDKIKKIFIPQTLNHIDSLTAMNNY